MRAAIDRRLAAALLAGALLALRASALEAGWLDRRFDGASSGNDDAPAADKAGAPPKVGNIARADARYWVVAPAAGREERSRIAAAGVSIEEISAGKVGGVASAAALKRLAGLGVQVERRIPLDSFGPEAFPPEDGAFHSYDQVNAELAAIADGNKDIASTFSIGSSRQGRRIAAIRFNAGASGDGPSGKPGIAFLGTHHAREHLSTEVPLLLARWLAANRAKPEVKRLLETRDIFIIPLVNPDGAEFDHADCGKGAPDGAGPPGARQAGCYKWQRKNLRPNEDGSTGVDLNRNYGYFWNTGGASDEPGDDTYHGPSPFSEPETVAVKTFVEGHANLKILLSYHTYSELILYPWGHTYDPILDQRALRAYKNMAAKMAGWSGYKPEQSSELYIASGDTTDWAWGEKKIFSFTFELTPGSLSGGGFYPGAGAIEPTFEKNLNPALYLIDLADDPYRAANEPSPFQAGAGSK